MRHLLVFVLMVCMVGAVSAAELGNSSQNPVEGESQGAEVVVPCAECPPGGVLEGEPPLVDGYNEMVPSAS